MNYATGCAFNGKDLFHNFDIKRLECSDALSKKLVGANRHFLVFRIFIYALKLIFHDIIYNKVIFLLPLSKPKQGLIHMYSFTDDEFVKTRQYGKFKDVDYLKSNFSGNELRFTWTSGWRWHHRPIYVNKEMKDLITNVTNLGKSF